MRESFPEEELLARMDALLRRYRPQSYEPVSDLTQEIPLLTEIVNELAKVEDAPHPDAPPHDVAAPPLRSASPFGAGDALPMAVPLTVPDVPMAIPLPAPPPPTQESVALEERIRHIVRERVTPLIDELARRIAAELGAANAAAAAPTDDSDPDDSLPALGTPSARL